MRKSIVAAFAFVLLSPPAFADHHKTTTKDDFKDWCNAWKGRWVGEVTWVADWPGLGKRGDKVTAYLETTVIEDGNGLVMKFYGGNGSGTIVYAYDAGARQIKALWVISGGYTGVSLVYRNDGKWIEEGVGSLPDGTKSEGTSFPVFSDGGDTLTITGTGTVGDKKQDNQHDVWRRVSK